MIDDKDLSNLGGVASDIRALLQRSHYFWLCNSSDEALLAAEDALRLDPESVEAIVARARALSDLSRFDESIVAFRNAIGQALMAANPHLFSLPKQEYVSRLWDELAQTYVAAAYRIKYADGYQLAVDAYNAALALNPHNALSLNGLGLVQSEIGLKEQSRLSIGKALELDPGNAEFLRSLSILDGADDGRLLDMAINLHRTGNLVEALRVTDEVLSATPNDYYGLSIRSGILASMGDEEGSTAAALESLSIIAGHGNVNRLSYHERRVSIFLWHGLGAKYVTQATQFDRRRIPHQILTSAVTAFEKLIELGASSAYEWGSLAWCNALLGNRKAAAAAYERSAQLDPKSLWAHMNSLKWSALSFDILRFLRALKAYCAAVRKTWYELKAK